MNCWVCDHVGLKINQSKAFAIWFYDKTEFQAALCRKCLDSWLDNADDDEALEPTNVIFL